MSFACGNRRGGTDRRKPSGTVLDRPAEPDTPGHFSTRGAPCRLDGHVGCPGRSTPRGQDAENNIIASGAAPVSPPPG